MRAAGEGTETEVPDEWLTIDQICRRLSVTRRTVRRWRSRGGIRAIQVGPSMPMLLHLGDVTTAEREAYRRDPINGRR